MPYQGVCKRYNSAAEGIQHVYDALLAMGWELWDDLQAAGVTTYPSRVYRSNGESGTRIHGYIQIYLPGGTTRVRKWGWRYWDNAAHEGHDRCSDQVDNASYGSVILSAGENMYIYGDKDLVYIASSFYRLDQRCNILFGHYTPFESFFATIAGPTAAGTNVVVPISETILDQFSVGHLVVVSPAGAGAYKQARIVGKDAANALILDRLDVPFAVGDRVGWQFHTFFVSRENGSAHQVEVHGDMVFTGSSNVIYNHWEIGDFFNDNGSYAYASNTMQADKFQGGPLVIRRKYSPAGTTVAILPGGVISSPNYGACYYGSPKDFFAIAEPGEEPATRRSVSSATDYTLTDDGAVVNWPTNSLAGKTVLIVEGPGVYQARRIVSNTSNRMTIATPWEILPNAASLYRIVSGGFRMVSLGSTSYQTNQGKMLFRETF